MTLEIQLDEQTLVGVKRLAELRQCSLAELVRDLLEKATRTEVAEHGDRIPLWDGVNNIISDLPKHVLDRLPADGAEEHDHYIYGTPKRNR